MQHAERAGYPEILADARVKLARFLAAEGIDAECADELSAELIDWLRCTWGGHQIRLKATRGRNNPSKG